jgi:hypothetical protein
MQRRNECYRNSRHDPIEIPSAAGRVGRDSCHIRICPNDRDCSLESLVAQRPPMRWHSRRRLRECLQGAKIKFVFISTVLPFASVVPKIVTESVGVQFHRRCRNCHWHSTNAKCAPALTLSICSTSCRHTRIWRRVKPSSNLHCFFVFTGFCPGDWVDATTSVSA